MLAVVVEIPLPLFRPRRDDFPRRVLGRVLYPLLFALDAVGPPASALPDVVIVIADELLDDEETVDAVEK